VVVLLDYLINERDYNPALFFKGFVLKYGLRADPGSLESD
jgi:hypothetical protein